MSASELAGSLWVLNVHVGFGLVKQLRGLIWDVSQKSGIYYVFLIYAHFFICGSLHISICMCIYVYVCIYVNMGLEWTSSDGSERVLCFYILCLSENMFDSTLFNIHIYGYGWVGRQEGKMKDVMWMLLIPYRYL